jgi:ribosomal-protein-alanine N-acetyltransferase
MTQPNGTTIQVRAMQAGDVERVREICDELPEAPQWSDGQWREMLAGQGVQRIALVATTDAGVDATIVGVSVASVVLEDAELEAIGVTAAWQRCGVGGRLLEAVMAHCAGVAARRLMLEVRASNLAARSLYRITGFTETGRRPGYYRDPTEDAVTMERWLA